MLKKILLFLFFGFSLYVFIPLFAQGQKENGTGDRTATSALDSALLMLDSTLTPDEELTLMDEYYLGRAVTANIMTIYKHYDENPQLTRYLNLICQAIVINSPQPEIYKGYHVIILDSPEFNAFASPGGHIMITKGLVEAAASEDMLAAIIAHELAHIMLRHSAGIIDNMRLTSDLTAVADRAGQIAARESPVAERAMLLRNSVTQLIDVMMRSGFSQTQEFEADSFAMGLLAVSGYNPGALIEMLQILQQVQGSQTGGFNFTHPSPAARISNANRTVERYRIQDTTSFRSSRFADTR
jgi:predicted Zn-dependent protease